MKVILLGLAAIAFAPRLTAQNNQENRDTLKGHLEPIEVRAIRASTKAPFAQTRMSQKDIARQNMGQDIPYLLQFTPSTVASSDAGNGVGYTGLRIRGTDATRINVTLNGVPVNDAESQGSFSVNYSDIASSLNSIQIQRGIGSSSNGSGAFGATLSMSNLSVHDSAGGQLQLSAGSFGTKRATLKAGTGWLNDKLALDFRVSQIMSNGFLDRSESELKSLQLNGSWKINERSSINALVMTGKEKTDQAWNGTPEEKLFGNTEALQTHYNNNKGVLYFTNEDSVNLFSSDPRRYNYFTYANQTDNYQQDFYQLHANHRFSNKIAANVSLFLTRGRGYYEEMRIKEDLNDYGLAGFSSPNGDTLSSASLIRQLWLDNHFYGGLFSLFYQHRNTNLTLGTGIHRYEGVHYGLVKWAEFGVPADHEWYRLDAHKGEENAFIKVEQKLGSLTAYADAQIRHIKYTMMGFRKNPELKPEVDYLFFNPKAGIHINLAEGKPYRMEAYASVARASKEPNRNDFEASPTDLPMPEQLTDIELGWQMAQSKWNTAANIYLMDYTNQLILTGKINDVGAYTRTNVKDSYRMGIELMVGSKPTSWLNINGNITLSRNKIASFTEYVDDYDAGGQQTIIHHKKDIAFSPSAIAALLIETHPLKRHNELAIYLQNKYVGRQYLDNTQHLSRSINPYFLSDLGIKYSLPKIGQQQISLQLQVNNLWNKMYEANGYTFSYILGGEQIQSNYYYPQAGRNWLTSVVWNF